MRVIIACDYCQTKYKVDPEKIPAEGRGTSCRHCNKFIFLMKPDAFYLKNYSKELAGYILHRKHHKQTSNIHYDIQRIRALEVWLRKHKKELSTTDNQTLHAFYREVSQHKSPTQLEGIKTTLAHFYDVLTQEEIISTSPLFHQYADDQEWINMEESGDFSKKDQKKPSKNWKKNSLLLLIVLLTCGVGWRLIMLQHDLQTAKDALQQQLATEQLQDQQAQDLIQKTNTLLKIKLEPNLILVEGKPKKEEKSEEEPKRATEEERIVNQSKTHLETEAKRWQKELIERQHILQSANEKIQHWIDKRKEKEKQTALILQKKEAEEKAIQANCLTGDCIKGHGQYLYPNNETYTGDWKEKKRSGFGVYHYANGDRYEGDWKNDQRWGEGTLIYENGDKYIGHWRSDKRFGPGNKHLAFASYKAKKAKKAEENRRRQEERRASLEKEQKRLDQEQKEQQGFRNKISQGITGCVEGNCQNGEGTYIFPNRDYYKGTWKEDKKQGLGIYAFSSGDSYQGEWANDQKHGQGTYTFKNKQKYSGGWYDGKKHGEGVVIFPDGKRIEGAWKYGQRIR